MALRRPRRASSRTEVVPLLCRWDLDKTYLRSDFDSIRQLVRTAFESAEDKVDLPGVAEVIKVIKAAGERRGRPTLVHFVSASPPQIGKAIRDKLALDGVPYDLIVFKNQLENLRRGKLRNLREHVGFKLVELLRGRLVVPAETRELLFGDDWESDPLIYSLYADLLAGRLPVERIVPVLQRLRVDPSLVAEISALAAGAAGLDKVERIFINLERRTPPAIFRLFGPRVVPTFNYFQTAAVLATDGHLDVEDVARVGAVLVERSGYTPRRLENSLQDLVRRGHLTLTAADALARPLQEAGTLPPAAGSRWRRMLLALAKFQRGRRARRATHAATVPAVALWAIDYDAILDRLRPAPATTAAAAPRAPEEEP
jgi:Phosphatidate phosphatase APP1, catalytic domain